jgi:CoA:oxalate CoA-transferase
MPPPGNDALFAALARALDALDLLTDDRFRTNASRTDHADAVAAAIEARLATATAQEWLERLEAAGVPCGPLNDVAQALDHRQVRARNMAIETAFEDGTPLLAAGNPIKLSAHDDPQTRPKAPALDEHRAAILKELGL